VSAWLSVAPGCVAGPVSCLLSLRAHPQRVVHHAAAGFGARACNSGTSSCQPPSQGVAQRAQRVQHCASGPECFAHAWKSWCVGCTAAGGRRGPPPPPSPLPASASSCCKQACCRARHCRSWAVCACGSRVGAARCRAAHQQRAHSRCAPRPSFHVFCSTCPLVIASERARSPDHALSAPMQPPLSRRARFCVLLIAARGPPPPPVRCFGVCCL
jgi:hypothetical protein